MSKNKEFPFRKTFSQDFLLLDGETITLVYKEGTLEEFYEWLSMDNIDRQKWLFSMFLEQIRTQIPKTFLDRVIGRLFTKYTPYRMRNIDMGRILGEVVKKMFGTYESIYADVQTKGGKKGKERLHSASLSSVCQCYNLSPLELFSSFTVRQYLWLLDGVRWVSNEQTKEGISENNYALVDREALKARAEATKQAFSSSKK